MISIESPSHVTQAKLWRFKKGEASALDPILAAANDSNGIMFVPGESTSTCSKTRDVVGEKRTKAYETSSMNEKHHPALEGIGISVLGKKKSDDSSRMFRTAELIAVKIAFPTETREPLLPLEGNCL